MKEDHLILQTMKVYQKSRFDWKTMSAMEPMLKNGSDPIVVTKTIYEAATDGTDKL